MFQSTIGRTRVPIFGRDAVSPLAESSRIASRTAVRETPNSAWMRGSVGQRVAGLVLAGDDPAADRAGDGLRETSLPVADRRRMRVTDEIPSSGDSGGARP